MPYRPVTRCAAVPPRYIGRPCSARKLYNHDGAEASPILLLSPTRSLHGRTAMGQGEMLHPIHAVTAGKPMRRCVPALHLSPSRCAEAPQSRWCGILARIAAPADALAARPTSDGGRENRRIRFMPYQPVNRCAVVSRALHRSASLCAEAPAISIMRNILARSAAPQMRSLLSRTAMGRENGRIRFSP